MSDPCSEGSLECHTYCDTGHPFIMVISEDLWHSHLLPSVQQCRCHYLFLRLRAGIRTPNLPYGNALAQEQCPWIHEIYNFGILLLCHYYYKLRLSEPCPGVEKARGYKTHNSFGKIVSNPKPRDILYLSVNDSMRCHRMLKLQIRIIKSI